MQRNMIKGIKMLKRKIFSTKDSGIQKNAIYLEFT